MAEPIDSMVGAEGARSDLERARGILSELAGAVWSAAWSLADEQKARSVAQVGGVAEAMRAAARSLESSQNLTAADYVHLGARNIENFARTIREGRWVDLAADIEETARRRPTLFVAGATVLGFLAARYWSAASHRGDAGAEASSPDVSNDFRERLPPSAAREL